MGQTEIYQHFNREDHEFIDLCIDCEVVEHTVEVTRFLNPHQVTILQKCRGKKLPIESLLPVMSRKWSHAKVIVIRLLPIRSSDFNLAYWKWSMLQNFIT